MFQYRQVDKEKCSRNMDLASDVYVSCTNCCPCGETVINMYKGADPSQKQEECTFLIQYLKGSKKQKELVKHEHPELYSYFEKVWALRQRHMVKNVPSQYIFFLVCCLEPDCFHPICKSQNVTQLPTWYRGPSLSCIPLPIPDPNHLWGRADCDQCRGICSGHFLKPSEALNSILTSMAVPPSVVLREAFQECSQYPPSEADCEMVFFSPLIKSECGSNTYIPLQKSVGGVLLMQLLREEKQASKQERRGERERLYCCAACLGPYHEFTESVEDWIGCKTCNSWFYYPAAAHVQSGVKQLTFGPSVCLSVIKKILLNA